MNRTVYPYIDKYCEVYCGSGDTVEISVPYGGVETATVTSCSITTITCELDTGTSFSVKRKDILSMAHASHQKNQIEVEENDLVSFIIDTGNNFLGLGVVTKVSKSLSSVFVLSGEDRNKTKEIWIKHMYFIGRGFNISTYYNLKENKMAVEYSTLYTFFNKALIPNQFQEEMGIPKFVYDLGEHFPIVVSLTDKLQNSGRSKSKDDSCIGTQVTRKKKKKRLFSSSEGQMPNLAVEIPYESSINMKGHISPDVLTVEEALAIDKDSKSSLMRTYQTTKDRLIEMWLNINEKVSPKGKRMKEESKECYVAPLQEMPSELSNEMPETLSEYNKSAFPQDSTHYVQYLSGSKKSEFYKNYKSDKKKLARLRNFPYCDMRIKLPPVPLVTCSKSKDKHVRFCVNVNCHEYPSY